MLTVQVVAKNREADGIHSFRLEAVDGPSLPAFTAGAHIDVAVAEGVTRQYSLCNPPAAAPDHYLIGVLRDPASRGGSRILCDKVTVGQTLRISAPRNHFSLADSATNNVLIAGGIGITPILAMAEQLATERRPFTLHYCARSRDKAAFLSRLTGATFADDLHTHFDDGDAGQRFDAAAVATAAALNGAHLYVCGPAGFIDHVLNAAQAAGIPETRQHREYFAAATIATGNGQAFDIEIASTGAIITVSADETAAAALNRHGFDIPMSCEQGVCGTCLTTVLSGVPDHRDTFLNKAERAANDQFLPCCSRSLSPRLVLDL